MSVPYQRGAVLRHREGAPKPQKPPIVIRSSDYFKLNGHTTTTIKHVPKRLTPEAKPAVVNKAPEPSKAPNPAAKEFKPQAKPSDGSALANAAAAKFYNGDVYAKGDRIVGLSNYRKTKGVGEWYSATVVKLNPDGSYFVDWDNGFAWDRNKNVWEMRRAKNADRHENVPMKQPLSTPPEATPFTVAPDKAGW